MVHRDDLAELYVRAAESGLGGEVLNATDRSRATVNECAAAASLAAGAEGRVEHVPVEQAVAAMGPFATCLALNQHVDSWKAVHRLGWVVRHGGFVDAAPRLLRLVESSPGAAGVMATVRRADRRWVLGTLVLRDPAGAAFAAVAEGDLIRVLIAGRPAPAPGARRG